MYVPPLFREEDEAAVTAHVRANPFATLVTTGAEGLFVTHLPVVHKPQAGALGAFAGHIARANPHWQKADPQAEAVLIFSGPNGYISPSFYATKAETHKVVPTWNYAVVHAYGRITFPQGPEFLRENLTDLTAMFEQNRPQPWAMSDAPEDFIAQQMRAIVGVWFEVSRIEAKTKMSQNRPSADVDGVIAGLSASGDPMDQTVAALVSAKRRR